MGKQRAHFIYSNDKLQKIVVYKNLTDHFGYVYTARLQLARVSLLRPGGSSSCGATNCNADIRARAEAQTLRPHEGEPHKPGAPV